MSVDPNSRSLVHDWTSSAIWILNVCPDHTRSHHLSRFLDGCGLQCERMAEACLVGDCSRLLSRCGGLFLLLFKSLKHLPGGCYILTEDEPAYLWRRRQRAWWTPFSLRSLHCYWLNCLKTSEPVEDHQPWTAGIPKRVSVFVFKVTEIVSNEKRYIKKTRVIVYYYIWNVKWVIYSLDLEMITSVHFISGFPYVIGNQWAQTGVSSQCYHDLHMTAAIAQDDRKVNQTIELAEDHYFKLPAEIMLCLRAHFRTFLPP